VARSEGLTQVAINDELERDRGDAEEGHRAMLSLPALLDAVVVAGLREVVPAQGGLRRHGV
jgi:hypothetical protein